MDPPKKFNNKFLYLFIFELKLPFLDQDDYLQIHCELIRRVYESKYNEIDNGFILPEKIYIFFKYKKNHT